MHTVELIGVYKPKNRSEASDVAFDRALKDQIPIEVVDVSLSSSIANKISLHNDEMKKLGKEVLSNPYKGAIQ
jgi:translation elongation factor EF-4